MSCITKIASNILLDCDNAPSQGIETRVVLINRADINRSTFATAVDGSVDFDLNVLTTGYLLEGVKQINSYNATVTIDDATVNKVAHAFVGRIYNISTASRTFINSLINGANLVAVVEKLAKGEDDEFAYQVLGYHNGLYLSEGVENSAENDGAFTFTLASSPLALEPRMPYTFLDTNYATSKTKFDNAFIGPLT